MDDQFLSTIARESAALAAAAERLGPDAPVLSCPGWDVATLVTHIAHVQLWAATIVRTAAAEKPAFGTEPAPERDGLVPWFRGATAGLLDALRAADPGAPVWSWFPGSTMSFWARRQAHEVTIHRWDAEDAAGAASPIGPAFAADGVDEVLGLAVARYRARFAGAGQTIALEAVDAGRTWRLALGTAGLEVGPGAGGAAGADALARGTASDIDLFLWGRVPASVFEIDGDVEALVALQRVVP